MSDDLKGLPGMKERDLVALGPCAICHKKLFEGAGVPLFYVVEISRAGIASAAAQRRVGLGLMMGGEDVIASAFSPDEDLAKVLDGPRRVMVHEACAGEITHLFQLLEGGA